MRHRKRVHPTYLLATSVECFSFIFTRLGLFEFRSTFSISEQYIVRVLALRTRRASDIAFSGSVT